MITLFTLLLGCNLGGNTPPKFKKFNGEEVKYLFGFAYVPSSVFEPEVVTANTRWNISVEVSDANGDDVTISFPSAPGQIEFNQDNKTGYWDIPIDVVDYYPTLQVLAVDEQGASDILIYPLEIFQQWDTGLWDTGDWRDDWGFEGPHLIGDFRVDETTGNIEGSVQFLGPQQRCKITWSEVTGTREEPCELCEHSWQLVLREGSPETSQPSCLDTITQFEDQSWGFGWAENVQWEGLNYQSPLLYNHPTAGWVPFGQATFQQQRFSFQLDLNNDVLN